MEATVKEVLEFVKVNDVKFIRLAFCDLFGKQKNISIMPNKLEEAFQQGVSFDAGAIEGFTDVARSELFLYPDPATLSVLPWRPQQGRVVRFYCDIKNVDGSTFSYDTRGILREAVKRCEEKGYVCKVGTECEFYLFKTDENGAATSIPFDNGGYLDVAPLDKGENVRREICLYLEEMGINPESSHHERGPGQNEIDFKCSDALSSADNLVTFKTVVKTTAASNGLFASFLPKPLLGENGSGLHINLSLSKNGYNIFRNNDEGHSKTAESFIAGILNKIIEITVFLNPIANSYERLGVLDAPQYLSWSHGNRSRLVRIPVATGEKVRMELRSPDPTINPYLVFALIIHAGLDGIEGNMVLPEPKEGEDDKGEGAWNDPFPCLPKNMGEAIQIAENSQFLKKYIGSDVLAKYLFLKKQEENEFSQTSNKEEYYYG